MNAQRIAATFVIAAAAQSCVGVFAGTLSGKVVGVADGDTVTVLVDHMTVQVRVAGIDAPEKKQAFGQVSKQGLSTCAFGQQIHVEWRKRDRYGRTVGKIMVGTIDCGLRQIEKGLAWHYKEYAKEQTARDRDAYAHAETSAREARVGLWGDSVPLEPWVFRHQRRVATEAE